MEKNSLSQNELDIKYMRRAIELAYRAGVNAAPNPMVGAVIVFNNEIIGEGFHQEYGQPHAEVNAINNVSNKALLSKSSIYVSLEPCSHFGKTPPCADLLVKSNFKRVIIATIDPFSKVSGEGIQKLKNANIDYTLGVCEQESIELNKRFFTLHKKQRPYVILKWAQSSDGFMAPESHYGIHWITTEETQVLTHQWRTQEMAILVGKNTINKDNPSLTARAFAGNSPLRIVLDRQLKADQNATVFTDNEKTWILNEQKSEIKNNKEWIKLDSLSVENILQLLFHRGISSVIVEGGKKVLSSFIQSGMWDESRILTGNKPLFNGLESPNVRGNEVFNEKLNVCDSLKIIKNTLL